MNSAPNEPSSAFDRLIELSAGPGKQPHPPQRDRALVYIVCHALFLAGHLAIVAAFVWLSVQLRSGWVLLGIAWSVPAYQHDFGHGRKPVEKEAAR